MEIKAELNNATEEQKLEFIVEYNHNQSYIIEQEIASEEEIVDEEGNTTIVYTYNLKALGYTEEEIATQERERIAKLYLTGADVERGIYQAKGIDFEDIIEMVETLIFAEAPQVKGIDLKALRIELKANHFYRGNPYVSAVGALLGFTEKMLDKFFETNDYTYLLPLVEPESEEPIEVEDENTENATV
jgi:hypothetical protein